MLTRRAELNSVGSKHTSSSTAAHHRKRNIKRAETEGGTGSSSSVPGVSRKHRESKTLIEEALLVCGGQGSPGGQAVGGARPKNFF